MQATGVGGRAVWTPAKSRPWGPARALLCAAVMALAGPACAQFSPCGTLDTHYGPYDYRTDRSKLGIVEQYHFTPGIEALISGRSAPIEAELDYTLRAFPNHHRALAAMVKLGERKKSLSPAPMSIDCYFERALRFRMDDLVVRMLFAEFLSKTKRPTEALAQLNYVRDHPAASSFTQYNVGMVLFGMGRLDEALVQAQRAQTMGLPLSQLKEKLKAKGKWVEPAPAAAVPAPAPATAAASAPATAASAPTLAGSSPGTKRD